MDISKDKSVCQLISRLSEPDAKDGPVKVDGTWGSFAPLLAHHISSTLKRPLLYVSANIEDSDNIFDDLLVFAGKGIDIFPVWETRDKYADATDEIGAQRTKIALGLSRLKKSEPLIIATCVQALNQPVPKPGRLNESGLSLKLNATIEPELVNQWLVDNGFEHVDSVDVPGQFAHRGGIIDIFAPVTSEGLNSLGKTASEQNRPIRVEFFGDNIESIRLVDLDTQRSDKDIDSAFIVPPSGHEDLTETEMLVNLLPDDTIILLDEPVDIAEVSDTFLSRVDEPSSLYSWKQIYQAMCNYVTLEVSRFPAGGKDESISLGITSAQQFEHKGAEMWKSGKEVIDKLIEESSPPKSRDVILYCENSAEIKRVTEMIKDLVKNIPKNFHLPLGFIRQGFIVDSLDAIVISHHEIFGQYATRRRIRKIRSTSPVESLIDLQKGDYVVHISYGIAKFIGIETIAKKETTTEYLTLEYAKKVLIHVPVHNIHLIHKYIGSLPKRPNLSTVGTKKWERQKLNVAEGVEELASELLNIQAQRQKLGGFSFAPDTVWQKEFDGSFLYQETPDQLTSINQIKDDMTMPRPMDRLLCGDVGYGKTELAMRAAFKAVESGKQVAVLVPTTVLCVQHGRTFNERFADFPVNIEILNRFVTAKKAKEITLRARQGKVDILIGTHRLLSKDVGFKDLGLLVIDEEQRFGVAHKERLKHYRVNVDILTMTATPIPRTLHLSMLGLRDISSLSTAPLDRRSIVTKLCRYDKETIRKAIVHELNRQGQVFFLHNRVQSIERMAGEIAKLVNDPRVKIAIAHGQMPKSRLEKAMIDFVKGKTDILVCSTIIESGLDIPNANTMIINDADRFGLAQLHQLRGRVGRYKHRAYAYMLLPATRSITPIAAKRLKAIEEYSQLGAGFRIALRDLEIRGAGNILGAQQSGHINTVGYEMYCRLLADAVKRHKNEPIEKPPTAIIDLGLSTYIPKSYIASDRQRMDVYRRISVTREAVDLKLMREELNDLYGKVPAQVETLLDIADIRLRASRKNIKSLIARDLDLIFTFETHEGVKDIFARAPGQVRIPDKKTVLLRLTKNYFEKKTLLAVLRKMLS
ncbi:MAG: transcription-repair coupling factor [Planctomycetes bacterium]|nr:transcription-repair coupling factor [Planctomycetota bacterium]